MLPTYNNPLRPIVEAIEAGDRAAYDGALAAALEAAAFSVPDKDYVDGIEVDILTATFQQFGYADGIPAFPEDRA
jgi:hypothetical protein